MLTKIEQVELPRGYEVEEVGQNLLLKRPNRYVLAAFGERVRSENIQCVAEADEKYLKAVERKEKFGLAADSETVLMFSEDVKEACTEFLLALEVSVPGQKCLTWQAVEAVRSSFTGPESFGPTLIEFLSLSYTLGTLSNEQGRSYSALGPSLDLTLRRQTKGSARVSSNGKGKAAQPSNE